MNIIIGEATNTPPILTVSIIIPCFNEEKYIARCLDSLLDNNFDQKLLEIVVVDGMSTDKTRDILIDYQKKNSFIKIVDNQRRIKPIALNLGIQQTTSDIVMRIDAHCVYDKNYISKLVEGIYKYNADNIGGVRITDFGKTSWEKAIGIAISHPFTAGNAFWRRSTNSTEIRNVDTVFCGCYRRSVFDHIGLFNERLIRTQDLEFNIRLKNSGGIILLDPSVRCTYYPRTRLKDYLGWLYEGGSWLTYAQSLTPVKMLSLRHLAPLLCVLWHFLFCISLIPFYLPLIVAVGIPILIYWILNLFYSLQVSIQNKEVKLFPEIFFLFAVTHFAYGLGELYGFSKYVLVILFRKNQ